METIREAISYFGTRTKMAEELGIRYDMITKYLAHYRFPSFKVALKIEQKTNGKVKASDILMEKAALKYENSIKNHRKND